MSADQYFLPSPTNHYLDHETLFCLHCARSLKDIRQNPGPCLAPMRTVMFDDEIVESGTGIVPNLHTNTENPSNNGKV